MPSKRSYEWLQNLSICVCLFLLFLIAHVTPEFGAMYEGLGTSLPFITGLIYHPSIYWGIPLLICLASIVVNVVLFSRPTHRGAVLKLLLALGLVFLAVESIAIYLPIYHMQSVMRIQR